MKALDDGRVLKSSGRGRETLMSTMGRVLCMAGCFPDFIALALDYQVIQLLDLQNLQPFNTLHSPSMSQTTLLRVTSNRVVSGDASGSLLSWRLRQRGKKARFEGIYLGHASAVLACQVGFPLYV